MQDDDPDFEEEVKPKSKDKSQKDIVENKKSQDKEDNSKKDESKGRNDKKKSEEVPSVKKK